MGTGAAQQLGRSLETALPVLFVPKREALVLLINVDEDEGEGVLEASRAGQLRLDGGAQGILIVRAGLSVKSALQAGSDREILRLKTLDCVTNRQTKRCRARESRQLEQNVLVGHVREA